MDLRDIQNLIKFVAKSGASEVKLEMEDVKITIKTNPDESGKEQVFVQQLPVAQQLPQLPLQQQVPVQQLPTAEPAGTSIFTSLAPVDVGFTSGVPTSVAPPDKLTVP